MSNCPKCNAPATGKFCGVCGTKFDIFLAAATASSSACPECGKDLPFAAKFCGACGYKKGTSPVAAPSATSGGSSSANGVVSWSFLPGELARKISAEEIVEIAKGGAKAFVIAEGQKALIYADGLLVAEMGAGRHQFLAPEDERKLEQAYEQRTGGVVGAISAVGAAIGRFFLGSSKKEEDASRQLSYDGLRQKIGKARSLSVVLSRSAPFLTQHLLKNVRTKDLTADVALCLRVALGDVKSVYAELMVDRTVLRQSELEEMLFAGEDGRRGHLAEFVAALADYTMEELSTSADVRRALSVRLQELSPGFARVLQLTSLTANREDIQRVRQEKEANLVAEQELDNLIATNRLCNRFQLETNRRAIEEARNGEEMAAALQAVNHDQLLREEQVEILLRQIEERTEDHQIDRSHAVQMVQFRQEFDYQKARLQFEEEITNRQLAISRQREAEDAAHRLKLERDRADFDHDEDMRDLDVLGKMQSVKDEQTKREHERSIEAFAQANSHQLDLVKQFAGMTAEQIMVANPHLTPHQAAAMAEMARGKAEVARQDDRVDLMREMQKQQQELMGQVMQTMGGALGAANERKDAELKRTVENTDKAEDRMMRVVNATVTAVGGANPEHKGHSGGADHPSQKAALTCTQCNATIPAGSMFCAECGANAPQ